MSFIEAAEIYILSILKMSYEMLIGILFISILMILARFITRDKFLFTKMYKKVKRYMYE